MKCIDRTQEVTTEMREKGINNIKCINRVQEVTTGMREKGINNTKCIDREEWRRKNKDLGTEKCENVYILYVNK
jgi:hypothetical protein